MTRLRLSVARHSWLALALIVLAFAVRIVVPAGMMPVAGGRLIVCDGHMAMARMAMPGATSHAPAKSDPARSDSPCAFTGLLAAALDTAALPALPPAPGAAIALLILVLVSVTLTPRRLWPHRRGPPAAAFA